MFLFNRSQVCPMKKKIIIFRGIILTLSLDSSVSEVPGYRLHNWVGVPSSDREFPLCPSIRAAVGSPNLSTNGYRESLMLSTQWHSY
jgi:hypothetical protein